MDSGVTRRQLFVLAQSGITCAALAPDQRQAARWSSISAG
jgi:hypothetical protein